MTLPQDDNSINNRLLRYVRSRYPEAQPADNGSSVQVSLGLGAVFGDMAGCLKATWGSRTSREFRFEVGDFNSEHQAMDEALHFLEAERSRRQSQFTAPRSRPLGLKVQLVDRYDEPIEGADLVLEPVDAGAFGAVVATNALWQAGDWQEGADGGPVLNLFVFMEDTSRFDVTLRLDLSTYIHASSETLESIAARKELAVLVQQRDQAPVQVKLPAPGDPEGLLLRAARAIREDREQLEGDPLPNEPAPWKLLSRWRAARRGRDDRPHP